MVVSERKCKGLVGVSVRCPICQSIAGVGQVMAELILRDGGTWTIAPTYKRYNQDPGTYGVVLDYEMPLDPAAYSDKRTYETLELPVSCRRGHSFVLPRLWMERAGPEALEHGKTDVVVPRRFTGAM